MMSAYTPHFAPFVVLAFLGTGLLLILSVLLLAFGLVRKSRTILRCGLWSGVILLAGYGAILLGLSLLSRDVLLPPGSWKYFCEIDCHVAYSVGDVRIVTGAGPEMQQITSNGKFVVVKLQTWFDPETISAHRGNAPLAPNSRKVKLLDGAGRPYEPSERAEAVLSSLGLTSEPLSASLRPGESHATFIVFEVPAAVAPMRLLVSTADEENMLLWTDENSPLHGKIYFQLPPASKTNS